MAYVVCTACNITTHTADGASETPACIRCTGPMEWLVPPQTTVSEVSDDSTLVNEPSSIAHASASRGNNSGSSVGAALTQEVSGSVEDGGPISRPTLPVDRSSDSPPGSGLDGPNRFSEPGLLPRQTPTHLDIPDLSPPKKEPILPPTKPAEPRAAVGPTPVMIGVLVVVAAVTGVVLALLSR